MAIKFSQFNTKTTSADVQFIVGYNGLENVKITPTNFLGAFSSLDFIGDTGTGNVNLAIQSFSIVGTASEIETSASAQTLTIGLPDDVTIGNNLTVTGSITQNSNTVTNTFNGDVAVSGTNKYLKIGASNELLLYHHGTDGYITNNTGDLKIISLIADKDVIISADNGSGGATTPYIVADGSLGQVQLNYYGAIKLNTINTGVSITGNAEVSGTVAFGTLQDTGESINISKFVDEADGIPANDNDTSIPTSAAVKDYVDSQVTAQDLDIQGDSGTGSVDLDSQALTIAGTANQTTTVASGQTITIGLPSSVVITGTYFGTTFDGQLDGTISSATTAVTQLSGDNSTKVATTAYVDAAAGASDTLAEVLAIGNTTGGTDISITTGDAIVLANDNRIKWTSNDVYISGTTSGDNLSFVVGASELMNIAQTGGVTISTDLTVDNELTVSGTGQSSFGGQVTIPATPVASTDAASKGYVDSQVTAQDLDFTGDSGTGQVDLDSQALSITGGAVITTTALNQNLDIVHDNVSRTDTTSTDAPAFGGTFTAVDSVTSSTEGHITAINLKTVTVPTPTYPTVNNNTITISAGSNLNGGGSFTLNQNTDDTITVNLDTTITGLTSVTSTTFVGALQGNADTATALAASGNITLTGDTTSTGGPYTYTSGGNVAIATTIADTTVTGKLITGVNLGTAQNIAATDTILEAFGYLQAQITQLPQGLVYNGTWNASTNTPTLTSGSGTTGHFYIVSVAGSTNLDGITDWQVGDWAIFVEAGGTDTWQKIDNTSAITGTGATNKLAKWTGPTTLSTGLVEDDGTTVTIGNSGDLDVTGSADVTGDLAWSTSLTDSTNLISITKFVDEADGIPTNDNDTSIPTSAAVKDYVDSQIGANDTLAEILANGNTTGGTDIAVSSGDDITLAAGSKVKYSTNSFMTPENNVTGAEISTAGTFIVKTGTTPTLALTLGGTQNATFAGGIDTQGNFINVGNGQSNSENYLQLGHSRTGNGYAYIDFVGDTTYSDYGLRIIRNNSGANASSQIIHRGTGSLNLQTTEGSDIILSGGNVGIGTNSPARALEVAGGSAQGIARFTTTNITRAFIDIKDGNTTADNKVRFGAETDDMILYAGGAERMRIDSSGNVDINAGVLNIGASRGTYIDASEDSTATGHIFVSNDAAGDFGQLAGNLILQARIHPTVYRDIIFAGGLNTAEALMTIQGEGNVGIGTTSPPKKLTIFGSGAGNATVQIEGEGGADPYINFLANNTQHWSLGIDDSDSDKFKLSEHSALGTNDYLTVNTSGNVGIGTASPQTLLDIHDDSPVLRISATNQSASWVAGTEIGKLEFWTTDPSGNAPYDTGFISIENDFAGGTLPSGAMIFGTATYNAVGGAVERMRIDSSGDVNIYGTDNRPLAITSFNTVSAGAGWDLDATSSNGVITMSTGGTERMRIDSSGQVQLNTYGSGTFTGTATYRLAVDSSGDVIEIPIGDGAVDGSGATGQVAFWTDTDTIDGENNLYWDSTNDRLGIGTSSPSHALDVTSAAYDQVQWTRTSGVSGYLYSDSAGAGIYSGASFSQAGIYLVPNTSMDFRVNGSQRMYINSSGNVGIGTTSPTADLSVGSTSTSSGDVHLRTTKTTFSMTPSNTDAGGIFLDVGWVSGGQGPFKFGIGGTERMRITSGGSVGIGETSVDAKLHLTATSAGLINQKFESAGSAAWRIGIPASQTYFAFDNANDNLSAPKVVIDSSGRVGIGITSGMTYPLTVKAGSGNNSYIHFVNSTTGTAFSDGFQVGVADGSSDAFLLLRESANMRFYTAGTERMRIDSSGITTLTAEGYQLAIKDESSGNISEILTSNTAMGFFADRANAVAGTSMIFSIDNSTKMTIDSSGQVGIGTSSPSATLHLSDAANASATTFSANGRITMTGDGVLNWGSTAQFGQLTWDTNKAIVRAKPGTALHLGAAGNANHMVINTSGQVGIGTTSPSSKLTVDGNGFIEGGVGHGNSTLSRIFAPRGAFYNGASSVTGALAVILPQTGVNCMMRVKIRVFDYAEDESFDVNLAGYYYSGNNWTRTSAWIDCKPHIDRNFTIRFGRRNSDNKGFISIGESNSTWSYLKYSVVEVMPAHSNAGFEAWADDWSTTIISDFSAYTIIRYEYNTQANNWQRDGQNVYWGSGTGNVGIGTTSPSEKLDVEGSIRLNSELQIFTGTTDIGQISNSGGALNIQGTSTRDVSLGSDSFPQAVFIEGSNGRVVIGGTTASANTLTLSGTATEMDMTNTSTNGRQYRLESDSAGLFVIKDRTANVDRIVLDSSGNVGIGTTSPSGELMVRKDQAGSPTRIIVSNNGTVQSGTTARLSFYEGTTEKNYIERRRDGSGKFAFVTPADDNPIVWENASGEFMRFNNSKVGIGTTSPTYKFHVASSNNVSIFEDTSGSSGATFCLFNAPSVFAMGSITRNGSATSVLFNTSSDYRLKEDLQDFNALDLVDNITAYDYKWKNTEQRDYGFVAHELQKVMPNVVTGEKDGERMQSVDYSKLTPVLLKAIQELKQEIETLKAQINN